MRLSMGLLLIGVLALSCLSTNIFKQQNQALAQQYIQTIKYRNLVIDLGNGVKTNAQLTLPAIGQGPFPGYFLFLALVLMIKMALRDLFTRMVLNHLHHICKSLNIYQKEVLQYSDMIKEVLVQIIQLIRMYGEMLQSMI